MNYCPHANFKRAKAVVSAVRQLPNQIAVDKQVQVQVRSTEYPASIDRERAQLQVVAGTMDGRGWLVTSEASGTTGGRETCCAQRTRRSVAPKVEKVTSPLTFAALVL